MLLEDLLFIKLVTVLILSFHSYLYEILNVSYVVYATIFILRFLFFVYGFYFIYLFSRESMKFTKEQIVEH